MAGLLLVSPSARTQKSPPKAPNSPVLLPDRVSVSFRADDDNDENDSIESLDPNTRKYYSNARSLLTVNNQCCCCLNSRRQRMFPIKDFRYIYDIVQKLQLRPHQKQLLLMRFTVMMSKIKRKLGVYAACHTCTKTCLIVGNILVPSVLSVEAFLFDFDSVREIIFWFVWILSIVIALISSFVTFCNTQKKYNLYNQFNAKIRRVVGIPHIIGPLHDS